ncbi:hypothetical protein [Micromonospora sp. DH14]|uniref:outer membrane protein assembly factor BamB family protein n=1 Tax=Micromonospora sp. DH14 TaxID=3040120 RepID=UPI00244243CA|nr:hypothetical protein [Micromonospora sp. DH14]MDG9677813.1 hypothetical protein [Micromonospora sp. DH14]
MTEGRSLSIIELGEIRDEPTSASSVRGTRAAARPLHGAAVLLLSLVVLAAAAPWAQRTVSVVPASRTATAYLAAESVFVVDPPIPDGERYLSAYARPAPAGAAVRRRWQAPLARTGDYLDVRTERGLVLATAVSAPNRVFQTTAFDAATGRQRWQHPGSLQPTADGGLLLTDPREDGSGAVSGVAPDTGRVLWSVPIPPAANPTYHHDPAGRVDRFVLLQPTGEVQVHDAGSGHLLRSVDTLPGDRSAYQRVQVVNELLLLVPPGSTRLVSFALADLGGWSLMPVLDADDPLVGVRRGDDGRMVVAELDLVAGRARIVDVLPGIAGSCQASLPVLLCQRLDGTTALWRLTR